jgi:hypothetical protein
MPVTLGYSGTLPKLPPPMTESTPVAVCAAVGEAGVEEVRFPLTE